MNLSIIGSAGWEEQAGTTLDADESGLLTLSRPYRGPKTTLNAFLATVPEGEADTVYTDLKRTTAYRSRLGESYGEVTLTFTGQTGFTGATPPAKVSKSRTTRTCHIKDETAGGDPISGPDGNQAATLTLQYGTALHVVEYVVTNEPEEPSKQSAADLPSTLNDAIRLLDVSPALELSGTQYLGGGFQAPSGLTAKIAAADYKVVAACINFERDSDGSLWRVRETWVAMIEDETA